MVRYAHFVCYSPRTGVKFKSNIVMCLKSFTFTPNWFISCGKGYASNSSITLKFERDIMKQGLIASYFAGIIDRNHGESYWRIFRYFLPEV